MKILHTADWHLGQRFKERDRAEEFQGFLDWLVEYCHTNDIDVLLHAGDVFDTATPPQSALQQYYNFFTKLHGTSVQESIVTAGNHDSPSVLNSAKGVLKAVNTHVVATVTEDLQDEIIPIFLENKEGKQVLSCIVCAVPFLRDKDIRLAVAGETFEQREEAVRQGIRKHYADICAASIELQEELCQQYSIDPKCVPIIAMGHLFAQGGRVNQSEEKSEAVRDIHVGNLGSITSEYFPKAFSYTALGHLHVAQPIGDVEHIQYSGSPIALDFSERRDTKCVTVLTFDEASLTSIKHVPVPQSRMLQRFSGTLQEIEAQLQEYTLPDNLMNTWAEAIVTSDAYDPMLTEKVRALADASSARVEFLSVRRKSTTAATIRQTDDTSMKDLHELHPQDVFRELIVHRSETEQQQLLTSFDELLVNMESKE
jgi:exonuclease SbcD